jgi:hypothetical protein
MPRDAYLKSNRLEDVIFLIQYLGYAAYALENGTEPDGAKPRSARNKKWSGIAKDHPELFRLLPSGTTTLAVRYYFRNGNANPPPLKYPEVQEVIKIAMTLHERQAKRVEVWRGRFTLLAALIAAGTGMAQLYFKK